MSLFSLRQHQQQALDLLKVSVHSGSKRPVIQAVCGWGKTILSAHLVDGALRKKNRVAFVAPYTTLIDQTFEKFVDNGICAGDMGIVQGDHPWRRPQAPVQICSVQTLARRELPEVDIVIVDECHIQHKIIAEWMEQSGDRLFIGLSATPWAKGMGLRWDDLIKTRTLSEMIDMGFSSRMRIFAPCKPDLSSVPMVGDDYHQGKAGDEMIKLTGDVISNWLARAKDLPTICFAMNRRHARSIHDEFEKCGIAVAYIDANTPREEREHIGKQLASGAVHVVVSIGALIAGLDWDVRCVLWARPTKSEIYFVQGTGRGLRPADGKDHLVFIDFSNTTQTLGLITDIDYEAMDTSKPGQRKNISKTERKKPLPKDCPACSSLMPANEANCLICGTEMPKPPQIVHVDGELVEIDGSGNEIGRKLSPVIERLQKKGKQAVYSELAGIAEKRKYSKGWTGHKYKDIFGVWPMGVSRSAIKPSPEVLSWVRSGQIRYAKRRENRHAA